MSAIRKAILLCHKVRRLEEHYEEIKRNFYDKREELQKELFSLVVPYVEILNEKRKALTNEQEALFDKYENQLENNCKSWLMFKRMHYTIQHIEDAQEGWFKVSIIDYFQLEFNVKVKLIAEFNETMINDWIRQVEKLEEDSKNQGLLI